jgi:GDP-mannose 4,6 dehydratase
VRRRLSGNRPGFHPVDQRDRRSAEDRRKIGTIATISANFVFGLRPRLRYPASPPRTRVRGGRPRSPARRPAALLASLQRSIRKPADRERLCRSWQFARRRACPAGWSDSARHRRPVTLRSMSPADFQSVAKVIEAVAADEIYNLSGQSSVTLSFAQPAETLTGISLGTLNARDGVDVAQHHVRRAGSVHGAETRVLPIQTYRTERDRAIQLLANDFARSRKS